MTLDVKKLLVNIIKKQMKIQHMDAPVEVFKKENIPDKISKKIAAEFGDDYLLDSNMIVFYRGDFDKDKIETLFNITNKAFGEDANRMTIGDFKRFSLDGGPMEQPGEQKDAEPEDANELSADQQEEDADDSADDSIEDQEADVDNDQDNADAVQQTVDDEDEEDKQLDKEVDEIVNEDDEAEAAQAGEAQPAPLGNSYLFLKITTK